MRLSKVRVEGFQSFADTGDIHFADGINLIIGQNNSGKSSLLRALRPDAPDQRHTAPEKWEIAKIPMPKFNYVIEATGREINDWILRVGGQHFIPTTREQMNDARSAIDDFFELSSVSMDIYKYSGTGIQSSRIYPSHGRFICDDRGSFYGVSVTVDNATLNIGQYTNQSDSMPGLFWWGWSECVFHFNAERMAIGEAIGGYAARLHSSASNLPNVLHTMANERGDLFKQLIKYLSAIFPTVGNLSVRTKSEGNVLEIRLWPTEMMQRLELSFPLNSSGTGVAQVVALLAAIMTTEGRGVIVIDEINTFLHPAAVKSLLRIIQAKFSQHQYIISTHSPDVIGFSNPTTVYLVKRVGYESTIVNLDLTNVDSLREMADHLGVSMSDVFAADRVIWVEGPTEELCFPLLYEEFQGPLPRGTVITSVAATGDFFTKKRDFEIVSEVYTRLCSAASLLVIPVAFSFDTETLKQAEKDNMIAGSKGALHFLPRRHFECYLIDPSAIAAFINERDTDALHEVAPEAVETALKDLAVDQKFVIPEWKGDIADQSWLERVDAAKLINRTCGVLSQERVRFAKRRDSLFLLQHIIKNHKARLSPLAEYVVSLVEAVTKAFVTQ